MYRHLLVALDDTDASIELVGNAVGLARAVGARITFLHAKAPHLDADLLADRGLARVIPGGTAELLAKAEAAARACGVPCDSTHVISDRPGAATLEAARLSGCDLIVIAAGERRGATGALPASEAALELMGAGFTVLMSGIGDAGPAAHAIGIIRDQHRSLAAALHAWMHVLASACEADAAADPQAMRGVLRFLEQFTSTVHEANEEDHLFKRLRERTGAMNAELDELQRQHVRHRQRVADLVGRVATLAAARGRAAIGATRDLNDAVRSYALFVWDHLGREEGVILPAAMRYLSAADWQPIEAAFSGSSDRGADAEGRIEPQPALLARRAADAPRDGA